MEGVPDDVNLEEFEEDLLQAESLKDLHDLHVWSLTSGKISLSAHI